MHFTQNLNPTTVPASAPIISAGGVSIEGSKLVVPDGYIFPPFCPYTGENSGLSAPMTRRVSGHESWMYLLILAGLLPYILVASLNSKKATFNCRISDRMTKRWRYYRILGALIFFGSFYCFGVAFSGFTPLKFLLALAMLIGGFCIGCGLLDGAKASKVQNGKIWLNGIPRHVRDKILAFENQRIENMRRAVQVQSSSKPPALANPFLVAATPMSDD